MKSNKHMGTIPQMVVKYLIAIWATFGLIYSIFITTGNVSAAELSDDIVILYTNDIHTYIDGPLSYDVIGAIKNELKTKYKHVILVDAGDHIQGTAYGSTDKGETIVELMNMAGYDLATLGNHEFDYGMSGCMAAIDKAQFEYISCNFYHEKDGVRGDNVLPAYVSFTCGDEIVAFVGITTPETFTKSTPAYFKDAQGNFIYGIAGGSTGEELYKDVQKAIYDAKAAGATKIIALGHLGDEGEAGSWTSIETIKNVSGLDGFIDGHSHSVVKGTTIKDKDNKDVLLTQTGEYFEQIGMMIIDADSKEVATDFIICTEKKDAEGNVTGYELDSSLYNFAGYVSDAGVKAKKDAWINSVDASLETVIGKTDINFDNYDDNGNRLVRSKETNTGDFCADALYYLFDNMGMDVDVAIMNGGGIRNKRVTGNLTYKICKDIHTFGNVACLQTVTGAQILDALEWGARNAGASECGGFLQVSGITYKVDCSVKDTTQKDDMGIWTGGPSDGYRVYDVKVYNKETNLWDALELNKKYNLAGYNYTLRDLGDGFTMFDGAVNVLDYVMEDYMVLANYILAFEDGVVKADNSPLLKKYSKLLIDYGNVNGGGRIELNDMRIMIGGTENDTWISKHGNVFLNLGATDFVNKLGYAVGDIVKVKFLESELTLPVVPTYSYVDNGKAAVIVHLDEKGAPVGPVSLAVNMGSFASDYNLAEKKTDEAGKWWWEAKNGISYPITVEFEMVKKGGYSGEIILRDLCMALGRKSYDHLSDAQFANFRMISTTGMGSGRLYRTSSPVNPELNRAEYAMRELEKAGVTVIMNLADSNQEAEAYSVGGKSTLKDSYYSKQKVIYLNLTVDFNSKEFKDGLAEGLRFFGEHKGVYAVHCNYGKDRAGFVSALLECLMGATYEEVVKDYMVTYYNYYDVKEGTDKYTAIAESNIISILREAFEVDDLSNADLSKEALEYVKALGLSDEEIDNLKDNLSEDVGVDKAGTVESSDNAQVMMWTVVIITSALLSTACYWRKRLSSDTTTS